MKNLTPYGKIDTSFPYEVIFLKRLFSALFALSIITGVIFSTPRVSAASDIAGAARVNTSSTSLNVRSSPSSSASVRTTLKRNTYVTLISKNGSFWYVRYSDNGYGYCHADYLYQVSSAVRYVKTSSGELRVRNAPSTSSDIQDKLSSGTAVTVLAVDGSFAKIVYNGNKTGYVHRDYLTATEPTHNYRSIRLQVPDYKQTDPRWSNITLGSSGQSIGRIGCATTALAMTESYRTGTTIYPHNMAKKLSYTSGGAVYWPTSYNIITSSSGYLNAIYEALEDGKPVIVGAKKSNGGQHYVVVTGVRSTSTLTTSAFTINDPGSNTRTSLAQFFSAYPYFYKMLIAK